MMVAIKIKYEAAKSEFRSVFETESHESFESLLWETEIFLLTILSLEMSECHKEKWKGKERKRKIWG